MIEKEYGFILDYIKPQFKIPFVIDENLVFKKPDKAQLKTIIDMLKRHSNLHHRNHSYASFYQSEVSFPEKNSIHLDPIKNSSNWNYYIIESKNQEEVLKDLSLALDLGKKNISIGIVFTEYSDEVTKKIGGYFYKSQAPALYNFFDIYSVPGYFTNRFKNYGFEIDPSDFIEAVELYKKILIVKKSYSEIYSTIENIIELRNLPSKSPMRTFVYFSIIDSLITHKPKGAEDSILSQWKTKINLINNQQGFSINIEAYFDNSLTLKKLIDQLYEYRSCIAHGKIINFSKKRIKTAYKCRNS